MRANAVRDLAYDVGVVDVAGDRDDHGRGAVAALVVARRSASRVSALIDSTVPAIGRPSGVSPQACRGEQVVHHVVGVVVVHGDLVEDHVTLGLDVLGGDREDGDHVAEHVDRQRQVLVEDPRVEAGVLLGGEGVELAADRVERDRDVQRRALGGALEQQVLEEVRAAVQGRRLVARADADPDPDAGRADAGQLLGDDPQPAGQDGTPDALTSPRRRRRARSAGCGSCPASARAAERSRVTPRRSSGPRRPRRSASSSAASPSSTTGISDSLPRSSISAICDLDLLADRDDVLDVLDPLATGEGTQLADVQQAVLARAAARRTHRSWSS